MINLQLKERKIKVLSRCNNEMLPRGMRGTLFVFLETTLSRQFFHHNVFISWIIWNPIPKNIYVWLQRKNKTPKYSDQLQSAFNEIQLTWTIKLIDFSISLHYQHIFSKPPIKKWNTLDVNKYLLHSCFCITVWK